MQTSAEQPAPRRLAVLVDGDNAPPKAMSDILAEAAKHGDIILRRVYGDWTSPNMQGWKQILHTHAFTPVQQFRYVTGKNSTDAAMIIDAMDILYKGDVSAFCIVSSDSDYTRLATRLREAGRFVLGIGEKKTPLTLVSACNEFSYIENLGHEAADARRQAPAQRARKEKPAKGGRDRDEADIETLLIESFEAVQGEDGWAPLGSVANQLLVRQPGFDPRSYGKRQLLQLVEDSKLFEIRREPKTGPSKVFIRLRDEEF